MIEPVHRLAASEARSRHLLKAALLVMLALLAFSPGIASLPPTDRDESRFIQATRQMAETGDFVDIRFQNEPRYMKPIGIYWLQSLAVAASGQSADAPIWAYRIVSTIAAALAVLACYLAGTRIIGSTAGFIAAIGLIGIVMLNFEARIAKTDATLLATAVAMQAALAWIYLGVRQGRSIPLAAQLCFWIAMALGIVVKGPIVPGLALLTIAALCLYDRDLSWTRALRPLLGLFIVLLLVSPWFIAITWKSGLAFWKIALVDQFFGKIQQGQESHGFPPGYYLFIFSLTMWPYALETGRGGMKALRAMRGDPRIAFLVAWALPMWVVFELVPTKLPHYVLPLFPAQLILMGWCLSDPATREIALWRWQRWLLGAATFGWIVVTLGLAAVAIAVTPYVMGSWNLWGFVAAALVLLAGWLGSGFRSPLPIIQRVFCASAASAAFAGIVTTAILPPLEPLWPAGRIANAFFASRPCPTSVLAITGFLEPSVVVRAGTKTLLTDPPGAARHLQADPACAVAAIETKDDNAFQAAFAGQAPTPQKLEQVSGFDYTHGEPLGFTLYRLPAP